MFTTGQELASATYRLRDNLTHDDSAQQTHRLAAT
jgi:hypothetical protein